MHALDAYKQQRTLGWTKIDLVLALQSKAMERIEAGLAALAKGEQHQASAMFARAQLAVHGLCCGLDLSQGELSRNQHRLYEFVIRSVHSGNAAQARAALEVLNTLYRGFRAIRDDAAQFEQRMQEGMVLKTA